MAAKILIPDTNVFMQCLPLKQVDWSLLELGDEITVLVPLRTYKEINNFKGDTGNARRARRAREVSKLLAEAVQNAPYVIREATPRVTIGRSPYPWKASEGRGLDFNDADQEIAGYALTLALANPGNVMLLTGDAGLIGIAAEERIRVCRTPDDWLPRPEPDAKDRQIQEQKALIAQYEQAFPKVSCRALDDTGADLRRLEVGVRQFAPLTAAEAGQLAQMAFRLRPLNPNVGANAAMQGQLDRYLSTLGPLIGRRHPPSAEEIQAYDDKYKQWATDLPVALQDAHHPLTVRETIKQVTLRLNNSGGAPAQDVHVELVANPAHLLLSADRPDVLKPIFPVPPKVPESRGFSDLLSRAEGLQGLVPTLEPADPRQFHWQRADPMSGRLEARCRSWRHQVDSVDLTFYLYAALLGSEFKSSIHIRVTASNLPQSVLVELPVEMTFTEVNGKKRIEHTFLDELAAAR